ncbi:hypothetical protein [Vibrio sagamiensis]|uniref:Uncharacterized protein n=1 Tax=Vibrio sagamiensis NBRC 104589 TaxID=1219064 RepID=A0A511QJM9_9VIBR|nr:hypothetical protein [Vibrio sagamiensis]GEM77523.1 hypothetical protein VSA01S_36350 [Vibrio sagamiensis NBRC 104589]
MQRKYNQTSALLVLLFLIFGSALLYANGIVASPLEKVIGFLSSFFNYPIAIALFLTFKGSELLSYSFRKYLAISFILVFLLEKLTPLYIYSEQGIPKNYLTMTALQLLLNLFIAKVITHGNNKRT